MQGISDRAKNCHASATLAITAKANAMRREGIDVIGFGAGEPDFEPPQCIKDEAIAAIRRSGTAKYTPASGLSELKKAIIQKFRMDNELLYEEKNISVNIGAKHTIYNILMALINKGDEVIIPVPYWVSYPEMVSLADGKSVFVNTDENFRIHASAIESAITARTKAVIVNSPSNPTGAVYDEAELKKIAEICVRHKVYIISDEIYEKLTYDGRHFSIARASAEAKALTFTVNGMSKSHAIPGWRLGYVAGPAEEISAINNIQSHSTSNPCSIVQYAAIPTLNAIEGFMHEAVVEYRKRRDFLVRELNAIPGISCPMPGGAFYVFPKIEGWDDMDFANKLLSEKHVAVVPGREFGKTGYVRLSYATSMDNIKRGCQRIREFMQAGMHA